MSIDDKSCSGVQLTVRIDEIIKEKTWTHRPLILNWSTGQWVSLEFSLTNFNGRLGNEELLSSLFIGL